MISSHYFSVQKLTFAGLGIDLTPNSTKSGKSLIKYPFVLYGILLSSFLHLLLITHYIYVHITDSVEGADSMPLFCQLVLCILKIIIFLNKREEIVMLITEIHKTNLKAKHEEIFIVKRENAKDNFLCSLYLRLVMVTGSCGILHPAIYALYIYFTSYQLILVESNKATYFWNHSHLLGYSVVYALNIFSTYFACVVSLAFDTLFSWFVSNIVAQFHIIGHRFDQLGLQRLDFTFNAYQSQLNKEILTCIQYHRQTLYLAEKLNEVYGEIIFIKFLIVCTEICSLIFLISHPNDSPAELAYKGLFLCAVALQLVLYCWNGQRIKDESLQVSTAVYCALDWDVFSKFYKKLLWFTMVRSQMCSHVRGVFFEVDLTLYLWVFKTASSLLTALKTFEEKQV